MIEFHSKRVNFCLLDADGIVIKTSTTRMKVNYNPNTGKWHIPVLLAPGDHLVEITEDTGEFYVEVTHVKG